MLIKPIHFLEWAAWFVLPSTQYFHELGIKQLLLFFLFFPFLPLFLNPGMQDIPAWVSNIFGYWTEASLKLPLKIQTSVMTHVKESPPPPHELAHERPWPGPVGHLRYSSHCGATTPGPSYRAISHSRNIPQLSWRNVASTLDMNLINRLYHWNSHPAILMFLVIRHVFGVH